MQEDMTLQKAGLRTAPRPAMRRSDRMRRRGDIIVTVEDKYGEKR